MTTNKLGFNEGAEVKQNIPGLGDSKYLCSPHATLTKYI